MDGNKEKTVVVTTSRDVMSKSQFTPQPVLLTPSVASAASVAAASIASSSTGQYLQQSSSDILRQSYALKQNMPHSSSASSISGGPRAIAPAPPGVLKATPPSVGAAGASVASIIRAPASGSASPVVGYSGIVGGVPKSVMVTPSTAGGHPLTAPGAILRGYPVTPAGAASRLPIAAASVTDPATRFQVTIVPSRASPTTGPVVPGVGVPGIVQLQPRTPSVSIAHHPPTPHASSSKPTTVRLSVLFLKLFVRDLLHSFI